MNKNFAEIMSIFQEPEQIGDYVYRTAEKYIVDIRESWERFMIDQLYELYKKEGFTKVLMISKEDFRKFLLWAIPKYKEEVLNNDN